VLEASLKGSPNNPQAARRDAPVACAACGRAVVRRSRQQRYCSGRCRQFALRENKARTAIKNSAEGEDTGRVTDPPKKSNGFNGLQGAKAGSNPRIIGPRHVVERELFGRLSARSPKPTAMLGRSTA
jgi:endogenous inhibitor of DNA gyrase (YacG/DUF329 family)